MKITDKEIEQLAIEKAIKDYGYIPQSKYKTYKIIVNDELAKIALLKSEYIMQTNQDKKTILKNMKKQIKLFRLPNQNKDMIELLNNGLQIVEIE